jgi:hypothetical protein
MGQRAKFWTLLIGSFAVTVPIVVIPRLVLFIDVPDILRLNLILGLAWVALLGAAVWLFRLRGLWLFSGLPFVLFWPIAFKVVANACAGNPNACP